MCVPMAVAVSAGMVDGFRIPDLVDKLRQLVRCDHGDIGN